MRFYLVIAVAVVSCLLLFGGFVGILVLFAHLLGSGSKDWEGNEPLAKRRAMLRMIIALGALLLLVAFYQWGIGLAESLFTDFLNHV